MSNTGNDLFVDKWSFIHVPSGGVLTILFGPIIAFITTTLGKPSEVLVISPMLMKRNIVFGHESLRNSISDLVFNTVGIILALIILESMSWSVGVLVGG